MSLPNILKPLEDALDSADQSQVLAAAWEAFAAAEWVAHFIAFEEESDEVQALIAAQASTAGRSLLPLPESGHPIDVPPPPPGADGLTPYATLLRRVQAALEEAAAGRGPDDGWHAAAQEAASKAAIAAEALLATRER
ncbi:hypothetical protein ACFUVV_25930 [Streptomyces sp. NPDC057376]|uniref:hypothetical protein n=1 Tax=unclassified Streptomyces TaxID=2593676 RepID=UPI000938D2D8|nr:hypothetical protein [Streptomyces sp. CB02414]